MKIRSICALLACLVFGFISNYEPVEQAQEVEQEVALLEKMNWIAEGVNILGQGTLLIGTILLHKNGLARLTLGEGNDNDR